MPFSHLIAKPNASYFAVSATYFNLTPLHLCFREILWYTCNSDTLNNVEIDIDFKENGTYEIITQGLGAVFSRGHYTRQDSIFILEKNWIDSLIVNKRLLKSSDGLMYQVDEQNKIIAGTSVFSVSDNKKEHMAR